MSADHVSGSWVHVQEEDTEEEMVFRPAGTDLPPARGRRGLDLREDGSFAETGFGAADAPEAGDGHWEVQGDTIMLSEGVAQGVPRELEVVSASEERLVIRRRRDG